jgi:hypothetical protein
MKMEDQNNYASTEWEICHFQTRGFCSFPLSFFEQCCFITLYLLFFQLVPPILAYCFFTLCPFWVAECCDRPKGQDVFQQVLLPSEMR